MPLSKRQRKRLQEASKMIESSKAIRDDMSDIQQEYASEIGDVVNKIKTSRAKQAASISTSSDLSVSELPNEEREKNSKKAESNTGEHQSEPDFEPSIADDKPVAPAWAKKLWKGIAKKCHPDALDFKKLSALEISRRQTWFLEAKMLFEKASWSRFLHIGVMLEEWVEDLLPATQLNMLQKEYNEITEKVSTIQDSLAWKWGTEWDDLEVRIKILTLILHNTGVEQPSRLELIQILAKLELE
tara:strand:+ start:529 stop:1257 length:729 start_codon:yes stop_codon:yes gene_type:complete